MTTHKTFSGMIRASKQLTAELRSVKIDNDRDYLEYEKKVKHLIMENRALWTNPENERAAEAVRNELMEAWNHANS